MSDAANSARDDKALICPICKAPGTAKFKPFCSRRCADVDLGRWFNESYSVPATEPPDEWDMPEGPDETSSLLH